MSRLTSVSDYQREIAALEELIREQEQLAETYGTDLSSELTVEAFRSKIAELQQELLELGTEGLPGHELSILVRGRPVNDNAIEADFLGTMLRDLQRLVRSLVAAQYGHGRRKGPWDPAVLRRSTLRFAESFTGSFGMTLEAVDDQLELEGHLAIQPAFEELFSALGSGETTSDFLETLV